jgi:hypothetical protein
MDVDELLLATANRHVTLWARRPDVDNRWPKITEAVRMLPSTCIYDRLWIAHTTGTSRIYLSVGRSPRVGHELDLSLVLKPVDRGIDSRGDDIRIGRCTYQRRCCARCSTESASCTSDRARPIAWRTKPKWICEIDRVPASESVP